MANEVCTECKRGLVLDEENLCAYCELSKAKTDENTANAETTANVDCGICKVLVEEDSQGLVCDVCNSWFHNECNETPLQDDLYASLNEAPNNVKWFCDKCIWDTEKWIKEVNKKHNKNIGDVIDFKKINDKYNVPDNGSKKVCRKTNNDGNSKENEEVQDKIIPEIKIERESDDYEDYVNEESYDSYDSDDWVPTEKKKDPKEKKEKKEKKKDPIKRNKKVKEKTTENKDCKDTGILSNIVVPENMSNILDFSPEKMPNILAGILSVKKKKTKHMRAKCNLCPKAFIHLEDCIAHKLRDHEGIAKPYKCTVCESTFDSKRHRERHMVKHSNDKNFTCDVCGIALKSNESLRKHLTVYHSDEKPLSCKECNFSAKYRNTLQNHMINEHSHETQFKCEECNRYFISDCFLKTHMFSHSLIKPFSCEVCDKRFKTERRRNTHMLLHSSVKPFECTECDKKFVNKKLLNSHMLYHTPYEERPHPCDQCNLRFTTISNLRLHKERHTDVMNSICDICGRRFRTQYDLKRHAITHTNERPHKCEICGKAFAHAGNLAVHIKFHKKVVAARCPICGYGAVSKYIINTHIREVHTNETPYECDICGSKYKTKGNLSKHKRGIRGSCKGYNASDSTIQDKRKPKIPQREYFELNENKQEDSPISFQDSSNSSIATSHIPTMQTHVNQPSLFLYANSHNINSNVFQTQYHNSIIPQNPRGIIATIQNSPGSY